MSVLRYGLPNLSVSGGGVMDEQLLRDALDGLECNFWACEGPTLSPIPMITCRNCHTAAQIAKRLGIYIPKSQRENQLACIGTGSKQGESQ